MTTLRSPGTVVVHPTDPDIVYVAGYDKVRLPFTFDLDGPGSRLWKSTDKVRDPSVEWTVRIERIRRYRPRSRSATSRSPSCNTTCIIAHHR